MGTPLCTTIFGGTSASNRVADSMTVTHRKVAASDSAAGSVAFDGQFIGCVLPVDPFVQAEDSKALAYIKEIPAASSKPRS